MKKKKLRKPKSFKSEVKKQTIGYITAAFGLVAGLAWNDAVKSLISYFFPLEKNSIFIKFSYAILLTLVLVLVSIYLFKIANRKKKK